MKAFLNSWYNNILKTENELGAFTNDKAKLKPVPGKWSANEILGHLVDSAIINHRRFILMQIQDTMAFDGYDQNKWVELQNYAERDFSDILATWFTLNINIIETVEEIDAQSWTKEFSDHSLDKIAWKPIPQSSPATNEYLVKDYFGHMGHHLKQIYVLHK